MYDDKSVAYLASNIMLKKDGKVALILRSNTDWMNGFYCLPGGKVEKREDLLTAAIREAEEEIGISVRPEDMKLVHTQNVIDQFEWIQAYFEVTKFTGEPHNAEPHMHEELAWLDPMNLPDNVIPQTKYAIECILRGDPYSKFGFNITSKTL
jgi:8-oxo-dGTP pyrophosphatase MutT (NUDIX family)